MYFVKIVWKKDLFLIIYSKSNIKNENDLKKYVSKMRELYIDFGKIRWLEIQIWNERYIFKFWI